MIASWQTHVSINGLKLLWSSVCFLSLVIYIFWDNTVHPLKIVSLLPNLNHYGWSFDLAACCAGYSWQQVLKRLLFNHFYSVKENTHASFFKTHLWALISYKWLSKSIYCLEIDHNSKNFQIDVSLWGQTRGEKIPFPIQMTYQPSLIVDGKTKLMLCFDNYKAPVVVWRELAAPGNVWFTTLVWH